MYWSLPSGRSRFSRSWRYFRRSASLSTARPVRFPLDPEDALGVAPEQLLAPRISRIDGLKRLEPALWLDEGVVGSEQGLVLEPAANLAHKLGIEVFRRPPAEIDVDVGLVLRDGDHLLLPWKGGMGADDGQFREVGRPRVQVDRPDVVQLHARAPGNAGAQPQGADMEERRPAQRLQLFP